MAEVNDNGTSVKTDIAQFDSVIYEIFTRINLLHPLRLRLSFVEDEIIDITGSSDGHGEGSDDEGKGDTEGDEGEGVDNEQRSKWPPIEDLPKIERFALVSLYASAGRKATRAWTRSVGIYSVYEQDTSTTALAEAFDAGYYDNYPGSWLTFAGLDSFDSMTYQEFSPSSSLKNGFLSSMGRCTTIPIDHQVFLWKCKNFPPFQR